MRTEGASSRVGKHILRPTGLFGLLDSGLLAHSGSGELLFDAACTVTRGAKKSTAELLEPALLEPSLRENPELRSTERDALELERALRSP